MFKILTMVSNIYIELIFESYAAVKYFRSFLTSKGNLNGLGQYFNQSSILLFLVSSLI